MTYLAPSSLAAKLFMTLTPRTLRSWPWRREILSGNFEETKDDDLDDYYDNDEDHDFDYTNIDRLVKDNDDNEDADFAVCFDEIHNKHDGDEDEYEGDNCEDDDIILI